MGQPGLRPAAGAAGVSQTVRSVVVPLAAIVLGTVLGFVIASLLSYVEKRIQRARDAKRFREES